MVMYSYVLDIDDGAAPKPYHGYCTLAICKPSIRRIATFGDWIIGTGNSKIGNNKLIYAMKVTEAMDFKHYFNDNRFQKKIPVFNGRDKYSHLGDNIYEPTVNGFKQLPSVHSNGNEANLKTKLHDLGKNLENNRVLISEHFYYFGDKAVEIPINLLKIIKKWQGHKSDSISKEDIEEFEKFISQFRIGVHGEPNDKLAIKDILDITCKKIDKCCED